MCTAETCSRLVACQGRVILRVAGLKQPYCRSPHLSNTMLAEAPSTPCLVPGYCIKESVNASFIHTDWQMVTCLFHITRTTQNSLWDVPLWNIENVTLELRMIGFVSRYTSSSVCFLNITL